MTDTTKVFTLNVHIVWFPLASVAILVTTVVPTGKVLPLGGLQTSVGGGLQPPLAVLVKRTAAPLELVAFTMIFEEQCKTIGGLL